MNQDVLTEQQVIEAEDRLKRAMLSSDCDALNSLLADDLLFTNHLGSLQTKQDDLSAHRSGVLKIFGLTSSEEQIRILGLMAVVSVRVRLSGTYGGHQADGDFRFTRVWKTSATGTLQLVAAHAGIVAPLPS